MIHRILCLGILLSAYASSFGQSKMELEKIKSFRQQNLNLLHPFLRFDGYYNNDLGSKAIAEQDKIDGAHSELVCPIIFFQNGLVAMDFNAARYKFDEAIRHKSYYSIDNSATWGVYAIVGDTINVASLPIYRQPKRNIWKCKATYYRGIITSYGIVGWHTVQPYPTEIQFNYLSIIEIPENLPFVEKPDVSVIDPSKAELLKHLE